MVKESEYGEIPRFRESAAFSDDEKVVLEYAEMFATDHLSITDELFERLRQSYTDAEILQITVSIARHLAFGRITQVMGLDLECALDPAAAALD